MSSALLLLPGVTAAMAAKADADATETVFSDREPFESEASELLRLLSCFIVELGLLPWPLRRLCCAPIAGR